MPDILELPSDNAARIAIYDAFWAGEPGNGEQHPTTLSENELFERIVGRLRILVPRELHLLGEREYVAEKLDACITGGVVKRVPGTSGLLALTGQPPRVRYPDATIRDYDAGLEPARERLELDDAKLRGSGFNVHTVVPSLANAQDSDDFRALVASMREHGYLKQFPIQRGANGDVVDGRARIAAAALAEVPVAEVRERVSQRRDTPLHRVLLALDANHGRLGDEDRNRVYEAASAITGRSWVDIEADLALTRAWRRATPRTYTPFFDVRKVRFRPGGEATVQITKDSKDRKVMLRSLVEAAGLSNYKIKYLRGYVVQEDARTQFTANRKAVFVGMADAISGITAMQRDRRRKNLKLDPQWNAIKQWLIAQTSPKGESDRDPETISVIEAEALEHA